MWIHPSSALHASGETILKIEKDICFIFNSPWLSIDPKLSIDDSRDNFSWESGGTLPQMVLNLPRTYEKLHSKGELYATQEISFVVLPSDFLDILIDLFYFYDLLLATDVVILVVFFIFKEKTTDLCLLHVIFT